MMEKKEYLPPKMEVVEMPFGGRLLYESNNISVEVEYECMEGDGCSQD